MLDLVAGRVVVLVALLLGAFVPAAPSSGSTSGYRALVFTKTAGFRHDSIDEAEAALQSLGAARGFEVTHTEDAAAFTDPGLSGCQVVVFLLTTGDVLSPAEESGLQAYVRQGGGFVGIHSASDTEHGWPWYGDLVGAFFVSHSTIQPGAVRVTDRRHASTRELPSGLTRTDEWYDFDRNPRGAVHVLASVSERSYQGGGWDRTTPSPGATGSRVAAPGARPWATPSRATPRWPSWNTWPAAWTGPRGPTRGTARPAPTRRS
jgi:type 1 glutamine amidotransferase